MTNGSSSKKKLAMSVESVLNSNFDSIHSKSFDRESKNFTQESMINTRPLPIEKYAVDVLGLELADKKEWDKYNFKIRLYDKDGEIKKGESDPEKVSVEFNIPEVIPEKQDVMEFLKHTDSDIVKRIRMDKVKEMIVERIQFEERTKIKLVYDFNEVGESIVNADSFKINSDQGKSENLDPKKIENKSKEKLLEEKINLNKNNDENVLQFGQEISREKNLEKSSGLLPEELEVHKSNFILKEKSQESKTKFIKKTYQKIRKSSLFFKVKNHQELVNMGGSYHGDFINGVKSFAISSSGLIDEQKRTLLGIASFFNYKENVRILIVTSTINDRIYQRFIGKDIERIEKTIGELSYSVFTDKSFDIIEYAEFFKFQQHPESGSYDDCIVTIIDDYDLVLWDVPPLSDMKKNLEVYFPLSSRFGNVSLIIKLTESKADEFTTVKDFFLKYGVPIKGIIIQPTLQKK